MKNLILISTLLFYVACHDTANKEMYGDIEAEFEEIMEMPASQHHAPPQESGDDQITKKVVKTGGIDFQSENIAKDYNKIRAFLPRYKAYIENENQARSTQRVTYNLTVRVPASSYDTLYSALSRLGMRLENKYSNIEDVTARYYDLQTRITNKKVLEQRYVALLKKASVIKDILEIEKNLNEVRIDIEQLQGQFNYLSKQVNLSTIHLSFYEVLPYVYESSKRKGFGARVFRALDNGWQGFLSFLIGLTSLWPFLILIVVVIYLFKRFRRAKEKNKP